MKQLQQGFSAIIIALVIGALAIVAAGGFYLMNRTSPTPTTESRTRAEQTSTETNTETPGEVTSTMPDIIGRGESLECDFKIPVETEDNPFSAGKLWTDGSQGRSTITANVSGVAMEAHAIYRDNTAYTWMLVGGQKMGFKFGQNELSEMESEMTPQQRQQAEQIRQDMIFNCQPWTPDPTKFVLPTDVTFQES